MKTKELCSGGLMNFMSRVFLVYIEIMVGLQGLEEFLRHLEDSPDTWFFQARVLFLLRYTHCEHRPPVWSFCLWSFSPVYLLPVSGCSSLLPTVSSLTGGYRRTIDSEGGVGTGFFFLLLFSLFLN